MSTSSLGMSTAAGAALVGGAAVPLPLPTSTRKLLPRFLNLRRIGMQRGELLARTSPGGPRRLTQHTQMPRLFDHLPPSPPQPGSPIIPAATAACLPLFVCACHKGEQGQQGSTGEVTVAALARCAMMTTDRGCDETLTRHCTTHL